MDTMRKRPTGRAIGWAIRELLKQHTGGLGFNEIFAILSSGKWNITPVKSRSTLSRHLNLEAREGHIMWDIPTKKYKITNEGKSSLEKYAIIEQIEACKYIDTYSDWVSTSAYILIDAEKDSSSHAIMVPYKRLQKQGLDWGPEIRESAKDLGLSYEHQNEKVWEILFKGIKRVILIETLTPSCLFEKLKMGKAIK